tara:strand:- start:139 stop:480 length:342 start_codon:yes stop_codon:yes gene_type:complete
MKRSDYDEDPTPNDPLIIDDDGLYITLGQMQYWLNRRDGKKLFKAHSKKFFKYYNSCRTYNLISELMDDDPGCAYMYWDPKREAPAFSFPIEGKVADCFTRLGLLGECDDEIL